LKTVKSIEEIDESLKQELRLLALRRNELHKNVARVATKMRDRKRERINKDRKKNYPNFIKGDFVLVGILNKSKQKLRA